MNDSWTNGFLIFIAIWVSQKPSKQPQLLPYAHLILSMVRNTPGLAQLWQRITHPLADRPGIPLGDYPSPTVFPILYTPYSIHLHRSTLAGAGRSLGDQWLSIAAQTFLHQRSITCSGKVTAPILIFTVPAAILLSVPVWPMSASPMKWLVTQQSSALYISLGNLLLPRDPSLSQPLAAVSVSVVTTPVCQSHLRQVLRGAPSAALIISDFINGLHTLQELATACILDPYQHPTHPILVS